MTLRSPAIFLLLGLAALLRPQPAAAAATGAPAGWRVDAPSAAWMVSDADRWVAWGTAPDVVGAVDTVADRPATWRLPRPCRPDSARTDRAAAGGRVLLACDEADGTTRQAVLDLRTGALRRLPERMLRPFVLPGIRWTGIGRRWVGGIVGCVNGPCGMWYDLATRRMITGILQPARDLDRPKLPRLARCRATMEAMPVPRTAVAGTAVLRVRHAPGTDVWRLDRLSCRTEVALGVERRAPRSVWLGAGLASWTTAVERANGLRAAAAQRATLTIVSGDGSARVSWRLPALPIADCDAQPAPGAWGRTAHTRTRAFFAQTLRQERDGRCVVRAIRVLSRALPAALRAR